MCYSIILIPYTVGVISVSTWFKTNRALAFGIMSSGSSLGGIVYPIIISSLISRIGFGWTVRSITFLISIMLLVANVMVKSRLRPVQSQRPLWLSQFTALFREYTFGLTCLRSFLFCLGMFLPFNFISIQAQSYRMSARAAGYLIVALNTARGVHCIIGLCLY